MSNITVTDCSLRDGNHSVNHSISLDSIERYCSFANSASVPIVEVGHGNGLGASSLLIGRSPHTDKSMLRAARGNLSTSKLGVHVIPGLATISKDIDLAISEGVDVFRVACHCTEATVTRTHIEYLRRKNKTVFGVLMMSALADTSTLVANALLMEKYGAEAIIIMDSTGTYLPGDVAERVSALVDALAIEVGFHAHNNLGCSISNSLTAAQHGATYIDGCIRGFGAGAGNAPLEVLIPVLEKSKFKLGLDFKKIITEADKVLEYLVPSPPVISPIHILTGLNKLFSGFEKPIIEASRINGIEYSSLIFELGGRQLVAGQEDLIAQIAQQLKSK
jgi:4-hydroxy 2-oxovalerate aldolase